MAEAEPKARDARETRLRRDARIALYTALALAGLGTWVLIRLSRPPEPQVLADVAKLQALYDGVDFSKMPEVQLLQRYIAIDTSEPHPDEWAGAEFLAHELSAAGLEPHVERLGDRRANVWAFVEGEDPKAIVLPGHIDVEPATEDQGWKFPPFSGVIEGPWVYGRGMYDMKSLTIAQLLAVQDLARSGRKPKRSVLFLGTSSEEAGSDTGTRWLLREHPELVARMGVVLTEGGVIEALSSDQIKYWGIEFAQKRFGEIVFCGDSRARLDDLRELLLATGKADPYSTVAPAVKTFLTSYASSRGVGAYQTLLANPERTIRRRRDYERLTNFMQALFRDELVPFAVEEAPGGGFELRVLAHLLPQATLDELLERTLPDWKRFALTYRVRPPLGDGSASPVDSADFTTLADSVRRAFPGVSVGPYYLPWAMTDSRFFRERGIPSYGFSPFPLTVTETLQIGIANERMQLPAFMRGVALYREILARMAG